VPEAYRRQGPLDHLHIAARPPATAVGARLSEKRFLGKINLRLEPETDALEAVRGVVGAAPPTAIGGVALAEGRTILCYGPNEWLLVVPPGAERALVPALEAALGGRHVAVTEVSETLAVVNLSGPDARGVLAKGCTLDLHPRVFGPGRCARSGLAKAVALIHQLDDEPSYDLYVDRTFAEYLWLWLEDAASTMIGIGRI